MEYQVIGTTETGDEWWVDQFSSKAEADHEADKLTRFTGYTFEVRPVSERDIEEED